MKAIDIQRQGHVAEVRLLGPGKGNALGPDFWDEAPGAFEELDRDDSVRVVVLRGAGDHFSYGLDLPAMMPQFLPLVADKSLAKERMDFLDLVAKLQATPEAIAACRKPVIAAIHGLCIGAGLDLIAACDVRLATATAKLSLREVKVAIVADLGSLQRLPLLIGEGATRELALTGRDFDGEEAARLGLVQGAHASPNALFEAAQAMAEEIASNPPLVTQGVKRVMNARVDDQVRSGLRHVATWNAAFLPSLDLQEAMQAFMEKRAPRFQGK